MSYRESYPGLRTRVAGPDEQRIIAVGQPRGNGEVDLEQADPHQTRETCSHVGGADRYRHRACERDERGDDVARGGRTQTRAIELDDVAGFDLLRSAIQNRVADDDGRAIE